MTDLPPASGTVRLRPRIVPRRALRVLGALLFASACCLGMIVIRRAYAHRWEQLFLIWNLALAWVPLPFSIAAYHMHTSRTRRGLLFLICAVTWFVFFPNAPYITTDFIHLRLEVTVLVLDRPHHHRILCLGRAVPGLLLALSHVRRWSPIVSGAWPAGGSCCC